MFLRGLLLLFGLLGVVWSFGALPSFWWTTPARDITSKIVDDQRFKRGSLSAMLMRLNSVPRPSLVQPELLRAEALIALSAAEETLQRKSSEEADKDVETAEDKVRASLAVSPGDSFLWLLLCSITGARYGFDVKYLSYLARSYASGPLEGWIALRRNRLGLAVFPMLSKPMQKAVVSEFAGLVDADWIEDAAMNLSGVGWSNRDRLLAELDQVDVASRQRLAKRLSAKGIKVKILGVEQEERPW